MRYIGTLLLALFVVGIVVPNAFAGDVPEWVKNTAGWWATDAISETEFVNAIEFLVKENIIQVNVTETSGTSQGVPDWIKNNAGWWASGQIDDQTFVNGIEFLIKEGIIQVTSLIQEINSCEFEHIPVLNNLNSQQKIDICKSAQIDYLSEQLDCSPCHTTFEYNSDGFRGPEVSKEKPDNTIRIFLVGGSTLANAEYADEFFTTKGQMQQKIDELNLDVDVEIVNAAIASAKSWHELQLAEEKLYDLNPDIIIHYTGWNDVTAQVRDYEWVGVEKGQAMPETWTQRTDEVNADNWFENFRDACETRERNGIKTIVALQPFVGTGKRVMTDQELDFFVEFGNGRNLELYIPYIEKVEKLGEYCFATANLTEIFDNNYEAIYRDGGHTLKKGMKIVADHLLYLTLPAISSDIDPDEILKQYKQNQNQENLGSISIDEEFKFVGASLANSDFSNQNLRNMSFFGSDLRNSDFSNSDVTNVNFELADLTGANFEGATVDQIKLKRAKLLDVNFSGIEFNSDLNHVDFRGSNLSNADLTDQDLKNTILSNVNMKGANLTSAVLSYKDIGRHNFLDNSDVRFTDFHGAILVGIDFTKVKNKDLTGANFKTASLAYATLNGVNLAGNDFTWANLQGVDLSNQDFTNNVTITGTDFQNAILVNANFEGVDLSHKTILSATATDLAHIPCLENIELKQKVFDETHIHKVLIISCEVIGNDLLIQYIYFNNFRAANLENVNFKNANLFFVNFYSADLINANISGADLGAANLANANLDTTIYDETTTLKCINHSICLD